MTDPEPADELADELIITLKRPVHSAAGPVTELKLREPTAGEWRLIKSKPLLEQQIFGVSLISGVSDKAVEKMPISDVMRAEDYLVGFIDAARKTGGA